jgi:hypothetical protein
LLSQYDSNTDRTTEVRFLAGAGIFMSTTASRPSHVPTQPRIQWVLVAVSQEVKRPVREADHSSPSSFEVNNAWSYTSTPIRLHGVVFS